MEISVPVNEINTRNVYFGEKRKNIIVDGEFVKIVYSTDSFEMNGMYILIELTKNSFAMQLAASEQQNIRGFCKNGSAANHAKRLDLIYIDDQPKFGLNQMDAHGEWVKIVNKHSTIPPKRNIILNILAKENARVIEKLCQIENDVVQRYIESYCPLKTPSYILKNQLLSGMIKYHSDNTIVDSPFISNNENSTFCAQGGRELYKRPTGSVGELPAKEECILKISGIWETATNVGITMKFILLQPKV